MLRQAIGFAAISCWAAGWGALLRADTIPPVQVSVTELPSEVVEVRWKVPGVVPPAARPRPRLPDDCSAEGEPVTTGQRAGWVSRQTFRCGGPLAGRTIGIDYPFFNASLSTLMKANLASGDRYARLLNPGEDSWRIPDPRAGELAGFFERANRAVVAGIRHLFDSWVHAVLLAALLLGGGVAGGVSLVTAFLLAQLAAVAVVRTTGLELAAPAAEAAVAVAAVLLARQALEKADGRRRLAGLVGCAGLAHGLGLANLVPVEGPSAGMIDFALAVLGMDTAMLVAVATAGLAARLAAARLQSWKAARSVPSYVVGGVAFALAAHVLLAPPGVGVGPEERTNLAALASGPEVATAGSTRVAPNIAATALQSFISVGAFEVRFETLVRVRDLAGVGGVTADDVLPVDRQENVKARIAALVRERSSLEIDGQRVEPVLRRTDFMTLDSNGALPRPAPVAEAVETAWLGVTDVFFTRTTPREVVLRWDPVETDAAVPATVSDPESSRSAVLTADAPELHWNNELAEDPVPRVTAVAVEPPRLVIPLWSLAVLALGVAGWRAAARRWGRPAAAAVARVLLAGAVVAGPLGQVAVALPDSFRPTPGASETARILGSVLPNIYRAFEFWEEPVVFDRLALSVTGATLTDVYLEQRRALALEDRGGARARVETVEVTEVDSVRAESDGGFRARASWTVGGTVTHFGHRHFRQNRYDAEVVFAPVEGVWKIERIEMLGEERLR